MLISLLRGMGSDWRLAGLMVLLCVAFMANVLANVWPVDIPPWSDWHQELSWGGKFYLYSAGAVVVPLVVYYFVCFLKCLKDR